MSPTGRITRGHTQVPISGPGPAILDAIAEATTPTEVAKAGSRLPDAVGALIEVGVDPLEVGGLMSDAIDAMTRRLIDLSVVELGEPLVPWAWLALGSAARREQGIRTDQDHALAYDPRGRSLEELDGYFFQLAEYVTSGLESAGIPRCHADVVAVNHALRRPLEHWVEAFETWMSASAIEAVRQTAILFDHRRVAGPLVVEHTFRRVIASSPERSAFVGRLRKMAMEARPRRHLRFPRQIDLKHEGLIQIVTLARILAIQGDIPATGTIERLRGAVSRGLLGGASAERLVAAFRLLWGARLQHQIVTTDRRDDELVPVRTPGLRVELREALRSIREAQVTVLRGPAPVAQVRPVTRSESLEAAA